MCANNVCFEIGCDIILITHEYLLISLSTSFTHPKIIHKYNKWYQTYTVDNKSQKGQRWRTNTEGS